MNELAGEWIQFMMSRGVSFAGKKVLDIGCGEEGECARLLRLLGADVYAIDNDPEAVSNLIATGAFSADKVKHCAAEDLANGNPFGHKFDVVICSGLTQYLSQEGRRQMVHGICHHCLAPGGEVAINIPIVTNAVPLKGLADFKVRAMRTVDDINEAKSQVQARQESLVHTRDVPGQRAQDDAANRKIRGVVKQQRRLSSDNRKQAELIGAMFSRYCDDVKPYDAGEICYVCRKLKPEAMHPKGPDAKSLKHEALLQVIAQRDFTPAPTGVNLLGNVLGGGEVSL